MILGCNNAITQWITSKNHPMISYLIIVSQFTVNQCFSRNFSLQEVIKFRYINCYKIKVPYDTYRIYLSNFFHKVNPALLVYGFPVLSFKFGVARLFFRQGGPRYRGEKKGLLTIRAGFLLAERLFLTL